MRADAGRLCTRSRKHESRRNSQRRHRRESQVLQRRRGWNKSGSGGWREPEWGEGRGDGESSVVPSEVMDDAWERAVEQARGDKDATEITSLMLDGALKCAHGKLPPAALFQGFTHLRHLSIANVGLASLADFPRLPHLEQLVLSDNRIVGGLEHLVQAGLQSLRDLDLSNNKIQLLEDLQPLSRLKLESLDLYECPVTRVPDYRARVFGTMKSLQYLDKVDANNNERPESEEEEEEEEESEDEDVDDANGDGAEVDGDDEEGVNVNSKGVAVQDEDDDEGEEGEEEEEEEEEEERDDDGEENDELDEEEDEGGSYQEEAVAAAPGSRKASAAVSHGNNNDHDSDDEEVEDDDEDNVEVQDSEEESEDEEVGDEDNDDEAVGEEEEDEEGEDDRLL